MRESIHTLDNIDFTDFHLEGESPESGTLLNLFHIIYCQTNLHSKSDRVSQSVSQLDRQTDRQTDQ